MKAVLRVILSAEGRGSMSATLPIDIEFTPSLDIFFDDSCWGGKSKKPEAITFDINTGSFDIFMGEEKRFLTRELMEQRAEVFRSCNWDVKG